MHILIIPSEEFLPWSSVTTGIFQYHQAKVLLDAGYKVGVISISQSFSYPMLAKGLLYKLFGIKMDNACRDYSFAGLVRLAYNKSVRLSQFIRQETVQGIDLLRIDGFYYLPPVENKNHRGWIKAGLTVYKEYVRLKGTPDVVHAHNAIYAGMLAKEIQQQYGVPYVITEHSTVFARNIIRDKGILKRIKAAYDNSTVVTAVSQPFCNLLNDKFSFNRFRCLHNVLDPDFENKFLQASNKKEENFVFINIAELHSKKDHLTLIKGFQKVHAQYSHARLLIGGDGDLAKELRTLVKEENLHEAVQFLGMLNRDQVFDALQKADCFVLTSKYETFGVVVIESMLAGKPVIVTKCGGPESFVTAQSGLIIEKENVNELVGAMISMIETADSYNSSQIRNYALRNFGAASFVKAITAHYEETTRHAAKSERKITSEKESTLA